MINRQFRSEWQDSHGDSQPGSRPKRGMPLWASRSQRSASTRPNRDAPSDPRTRTGRSAGVLLIALVFASFLTGCMTKVGSTRSDYAPPSTVSARTIFATGQLPPDVELEHLRYARSAPAMLRRAWLELKLKKPEASLDSSAQVLYAATKPTANEESFARYLRSEAFRVQGNKGRGTFDRDRARELALDPELQRRLLPEVQAPRREGPVWGRLAVQRRSTWRPLPPNRSNLDPMQRPSRVTIHHSAMYFRDTRPRAAAAQIGRIQREHMQNRGYGDIGYHFLIDPSGRVWEGRELRYQGAHASGDNNIGNIGICLLGNFIQRHRDGQGPTNAQVRSMEHLVVQMMQRYRFGGDAVYCHSDFKNTACPGPRMRPIVKRFARQLQARLANQPPGEPGRRRGAAAFASEEEDE